MLILMLRAVNIARFALLAHFGADLPNLLTALIRLRLAKNDPLLLRDQVRPSLQFGGHGVFARCLNVGQGGKHIRLTLPRFHVHQTYATRKDCSYWIGDR